MIPLTLNVRNFMCYTDIHEPLQVRRHPRRRPDRRQRPRQVSPARRDDLGAVGPRARPRRRRADPHRRLRNGGRVRIRARRAPVPGHSQTPKTRQIRLLRPAVRRAVRRRLQDAHRTLGRRNRARHRAHAAHELRDVHQLVVHPARPRRQLHHQFAGRAQAHPGRNSGAGHYDELEARAKDRFKVARGAARRRAAPGRGLGGRDRPDGRSTRPTSIACEPSSPHWTQHVAAAGRTSSARAATASRSWRPCSSRSRRPPPACSALPLDRARSSATLRERTVAARSRRRPSSTAARSIEQAAAELDTVRLELEQATQKQHEFLPLERAREAAVRTLATEQARLEGEVAQRERRLAELTQAIGQLPAAAGRSAARRSRRPPELARIETAARAAAGARGPFREEAAEKRTVNTQLKKEMFELRGQLDELEKLSTCPTCRRAMDAQHKQRLRDEYVAAGTRLRDEFRAHEASGRELDASVARHEAKLAELARRAPGARGDPSSRGADREPGRRRSSRHSARLSVLQPELAQRQRLLKDAAFAPEARQQLARLEKRIAALAYDETTSRAAARAGRRAGRHGSRAPAAGASSAQPRAPRRADRRARSRV